VAQALHRGVQVAAVTKVLQPGEPDLVSGTTALLRRPMRGLRVVKLQVLLLEEGDEEILRTEHIVFNFLYLRIS